MIEIKKQSLSETFSIYLDKRMLRILLLGAISGFPWVLIGSSLSLWLKEEGLSRSTIGWAGLIFANIKPAQPIVDLLKPSSLSHKLKLLPMRTQGNPEIAPSNNILSILLSK